MQTTNTQTEKLRKLESIGAKKKQKNKKTTTNNDITPRVKSPS